MTTHRRHSDPNHLALRDRAATLPHVAAHVGSGAFVRVVKVGGRAQRDAALFSRIHEAVSIPGARIVVVHGGGDEVTALQRRMGVEATFVDGRRVTSADDLDAVRMVLSGTVKVRMPFVGAKVERAIVSGLTEHAVAEAALISEWTARA